MRKRYACSMLQHTWTSGAGGTAYSLLVLLDLGLACIASAQPGGLDARGIPATKTPASTTCMPGTAEYTFGKRPDGDDTLGWHAILRWPLLHWRRFRLTGARLIAGWHQPHELLV